MAIWHRVFGLNELEPDAEALRAELETLAPGVMLQRHDGPRGWERLELTWPSGDALAIDRFWRDEEGIRAELQAWAAWVENLEDEPDREALMLHLTATQQVFPMQRESSNDPVALKLCAAIAWTTDGVYEIDGLGFFAHDGTLLIAEDGEDRT